MKLRSKRCGDPGVTQEPSDCHRGMLVFVADAIDEVKRALELDPLSLFINADLGRTCYFARPLW